MQPTKNDMPLQDREQVCELLNLALAECIDAQLQAKHAHWNVKGPNFRALHELFDEVAESLEGHADLVAERIVQLGGTAMGTIGAVRETSELPAYPVDLVEGKDHVEHLGNALAALAKRMREMIEETDDLDDEATSDICTEVTRGIDKMLWFVEAHRESPVKVAAESEAVTSEPVVEA